MLLAITVGQLVVPIAIIMVVVALGLVAKAVASRYIKVGPDEIAVFSGRKYKYKDANSQVQERGFHVLQGGGKILLPIVEKVEIINTAAFQVEVSETNIPNRDNVGVNVKGVATCKLSTAEEDLGNAVSNFLNKTPEDRIRFIQNILKGHVRSITGNLTIDQLLRERQKLNEQVVKESTPECKRIGIDVINLVIQDVRDEHGYIEALGKQTIAQTMKNAQIAVAEAERETAVKTSHAKREAAEVDAQNATKVADAQKCRDVEIANFKQETETKRAVAESAFAIAKTEQEKNLSVLQAQRDEASKEAQVKVQEKEALRRQKELEATTITEARANRDASVIAAEGAKSVSILNAETIKINAQGERDAAIQRGEGEAQSKLVIAQAQAKAIQQTRTAEAEGEKAKLLAIAEGNRASQLANAEGQEKLLLAQASGKRQALLAEAEGTEALAQALKSLNEQGRMIVILEKLPALLDKGGDAGAKMLQAVFGPIGESVAKIGSINITDLGGGNATEKGLSQIGGLVPKIVSDAFLALKARGIDASELLKVLKVDPSGLSKLLSGPDNTEKKD